jgi:uncharacterized protein (DUF1501 family)
MTLTRREFVRQGAAAVALGAGLGRATPAPAQAPATDRVVVIVNLFGGNDGLATVIPRTGTAYDLYRNTLRPTIGYDQGQLLPLTGVPDLGLNPALGSFQALFDQGRLAIINGVSVPQNATGLFDHEAGQYTYQSCDTVRSETTGLPTGWLGRYLDSVGATQVSPGIDLGGGRLALVGQTRAPVSIGSLRDFQLEVSSRLRLRYTNIMNASPPGGVAGRHRDVRLENLAQAELIRTATASYQAAATYPDSRLGRTLLDCAKLITANVGVRAVTVGTSGFDTHSGQNENGYHEGLLRDVADSVKAFYDDLVAHGQDQRVLILTISEFGRRAYQNVDEGTDHGFSSSAVVVGSMVRGAGTPGQGIYGDYPRLDAAHLFHGSCELRVDFRAVYATVLAGFLGVDPGPLLCATYGNCGTFPVLGFL